MLKLDALRIRPRGLKPGSIFALYAALKRRSSTLVHASGWCTLHFGTCFKLVHASGWCILQVNAGHVKRSLRVVTSAAKAGYERATLIAALKRCATQKTR